MQIEMNLDEKQIADEIIKELKLNKLLNNTQNVNIIYNVESKDILYTASEVAEIIKTNVDYVHKLRKAGLIRFMKLGQYKCRRSTLLEFLEKYEGKDLTDPFNVKNINE